MSIEVSIEVRGGAVASAKIMDGIDQVRFDARCVAVAASL